MADYPHAPDGDDSAREQPSVADDGAPQYRRHDSPSTRAADDGPYPRHGTAQRTANADDPAPAYRRHPSGERRVMPEERAAARDERYVRHPSDERPVVGERTDTQTHGSSDRYEDRGQRRETAEQSGSNFRRHSSGERHALRDETARRHVSVQRHSVDHDVDDRYRRHPSGERHPAAGDDPDARDRRHPSGERHPVADDADARSHRHATGERPVVPAYPDERQSALSMRPTASARHRTTLRTRTVEASDAPPPQRHGTSPALPAGDDNRHHRHGTEDWPVAARVTAPQRTRPRTEERPASVERDRRHATAERPSIGRSRRATSERASVGGRSGRHPTAERGIVDNDHFRDDEGSPRGDDMILDGRAPWISGDLISGRYEIERPLGGGSMGDVFLAEDRLLKKPVAVKVLRSDLAENRDTVRRFLREVALAHSVTHKNVVRIYDTGEEKGLPFFTMEVLQGQVLEDLLEGPGGTPGPAPERMPMRKIRSIAFDVLDAMEAAHRAGVVHRDLKPGNVMLTHRGAIVMDFGVAGIDDMLERGKVPPSTSTLRSLVRTEVGTIFGSPAYMAPELWEGSSASVQSDLYAFGVMLYQMLTGRLPFSAKTPAAFVEKLSTAPPPPLRSLRRDVPWNLVRLVRRCMARDPEERPLSASAAANLISPLRNRQRRRFVTGAAMLSAVAVGALWLRTTPSWRDRGLPDAVTEAELSAAVRDFDIGERAAALRRLDRLAVRAPDSAALVFWRATVVHDLGDRRGRLARCTDTTLRGSAAWLELARAACESTYRVAAPAEQALDGGARSLGPELLPLAIEWSLIPRLDADPNDSDAQAQADAVLTQLAEQPDSAAMWAMPARWALAQRHLNAAVAATGDAREPRPEELDSDAHTPVFAEHRALQALLDGDLATANQLATRLRPIDPSLSIRLLMHAGRMDEAWATIESLGDDALAPPLRNAWCGYAWRFEFSTRPTQCRDLPPGLTRALWDVREGQPADVGELDVAEAAVVQRYAEVQAGRCGGGDMRPPRVRNVAAPFELLSAELELTAALCPASPAVADLVRARTLATTLSTLSPGDPWLLVARARVDDAEGHDKLAEAKRLAASERWSGANTALPMASQLRQALGIPSKRAKDTVAGRKH